jgi:hypothetical protein
VKILALSLVKQVSSLVVARKVDVYRLIAALPSPM